jgi:hypothetical protein
MGWIIPHSIPIVHGLILDATRQIAFGLDNLEFGSETLKMEELHLFGVPMAKATVYETPSLKAQFLPEILRRYEEGAYAIPAAYDSDRIHTSYGAENKDQVFHPIPGPYDQLIRQFVGGAPFSAEIWHSVYGSGNEYQERRHQLPGHISLLHFLSFDPSQHQRPIFYSPDGLVRAHCNMSGVQPEIWLEETKMDFYEGDALIFPAYLEHCILAGVYRNPMVIVSINVTVTNSWPGNSSTGDRHGD